MSRLYVGTSGWVYPDWQGIFYPSDLPQRKWLEFYSQHFKTVEINATFYHQMKPATFENWFVSTPDDFVFAVKASRFITHIKRLKDVGDPMDRFCEPTTSLGKKLGPILLQLPPRFKADEKRLEAFLVHCSQLTRFASEARRAVDSKKYEKKSVNRQLTTVNRVARLDSRLARLAFEFRDPSWFSEPIYKILRKYNAALVIAESGGYWPSEEVVTADFTYIRFHGEGGSYATKYTDSELEVWAKKIKKLKRQGTDVYAYFNNDVGGFAVENAKTLIGLV